MQKVNLKLSFKYLQFVNILIRGIIKIWIDKILSAPIPAALWPFQVKEECFYVRKRLIIIITTTFTLAFKWFPADVTLYRLNEWVYESCFNAARSVFAEWFDFNVCICVFRRDIYYLQSDNPVGQSHVFISITTRVVTELMSVCVLELSVWF